MENKYYVYRHRRLDNDQIFYVGLGSSKNYKRAFVKYQKSKLWNNVVNKAGYDVEIVMESLNREEACELEEFLIFLYGRRDLELGNLVNLTNGGESNSGAKQSEEIKKWRSDKWKGENNPSYGKKGALNHNYKKPRTEETKRKISESNKGKKRSEEAIIKMSKIKHLSGAESPTAYTVQHIDTGEIFICLREACKYFGLNYEKERHKTGRGFSTASFIIISQKQKKTGVKSDKSTHISKKVIDTETCIIYDSATKAAKHLGLHVGVLGRYLRREVPNKTTFIFLEDYDGTTIKPATKNPTSVIDTSNSITYNNIREASKATNIKYKKLYKQLNGEVENKTTLILCRILKNADT